MNENNKVELRGEIASQFTFSHQVFGEGFYMFTLAVKRLSDEVDYIPVMVSERLIDIAEDCTGYLIHVSGQFRSHNQSSNGRSRLILSAFATEIEFLSEIGEHEQTNQIFLDGYICKEPIYRKTHLGREIADVLLAVNRPYGKSDYIPCICWGRNALFASGLEVGSHIRMNGRIQSREYMKRISDKETEQRIAYEVSVARLEVAGEA